MQPRTMFTTTSLKIICMLFCSPNQMNCVIWKKYKAIEGYAGKMCPTNLVERELVVSSQLQCLVTCSAAPQCKATVYHKNNTTCYSLKEGYEQSGWSAKLVGAKMYIKASCPEGWTFLHRACYRITDGKHTRDSMTTVCKALDENANLAYTIKPSDEERSVHRWMFNVLLAEYDRHGGVYVQVWLSVSMYYYGNGNPIVYRSIKLNSKRTSFAYFWKIGGPLNGLCELDVQ